MPAMSSVRVGRRGGAAVVEDGVAAALAGAVCVRGGLVWDRGDFTGGGISAGCVEQVDGDAVQEGVGQPFGTGVDGFPAAVFDEAFEETDDAVRAAEQVLGHRA